MTQTIEADLIPVETPFPSFAFVELGLAEIESDDVENRRWLPLVPLGTWEHPLYGELDITAETIQRMHENHEAGLPGTDLPIDVDHSWGEAAGWLIRTEAREDALWGLLELNDSGMEMVRDRRYRYISPEWFPQWKDPRTGEYHEDVLTSVALTNRPFFKELPALEARRNDAGRMYLLPAYRFIWEDKPDAKEIWYRIRDQKDFRPDTFRSQEMTGVKGLRMILARLKADKVPEGHDPEALVLQALRFDREHWTLDRAKEWVSAHKDELKAAAPAADDIRHGAQPPSAVTANEGGTQMPDPKDPKKTTNSDPGANQDPGATDKGGQRGTDPREGGVSAAEFKALGARAEAAEKRAEAAEQHAARIGADLERRDLKARIGSMKFGDPQAGPQRVLAPAHVDGLVEAAMKYKAGEERDKFLKDLQKLSFVELGERGGDEVPEGGTAEQRLQAAVQQKIEASEGKLSYGDAVRAVAAEQPTLLEEREREQRGA